MSVYKAGIKEFEHNVYIYHTFAVADPDKCDGGAKLLLIVIGS